MKKPDHNSKTATQQTRRSYQSLTLAGKKAVTLLPVMNDAMISRETGITRQRVGKIRMKFHIRNPFRHVRSNDSLCNEALVSHLIKMNGKFPSSHIRKTLGISASTLACLRSSIGLPSPCIAPERSHKPRKVDLGKLKELICLGNSIYRTARALNVTRPTVYFWIRELSLRPIAQKKENRTNNALRHTKKEKHAYRQTQTR